MELGRTQKLEIVRMVDFGAYLGTEEEQVLLPKKQVPEGANVGDEVKVFIYRDSQDRLIATVNKPLVELDCSVPIGICCKKVKGGRSVLELPSGTASQLGLKENDLLEVL